MTPSMAAAIDQPFDKVIWSSTICKAAQKAPRRRQSPGWAVYRKTVRHLGGGVVVISSARRGPSRQADQRR